jgi:MFS family permease
MTASEVSKRSRSPIGFTFIAPLALGATLNPINSTMLSTALVPIAESFHVDLADTGWLIAVLYLTTAVAQPSLGRLVDLFGARRVYLASLFLVAAAGILAQLASSLAGLVAVRAPIRRRCGCSVRAPTRQRRRRRASPWGF